MSPADPLHSLRYPIVQAPMAGGPSTPALAAAVSRAGGLGFLAAGYKTVEQVERELVEVRSLVPAGVPYGLNLFAPPGHGTGAAEVDAYADTLRDEAQVLGVDLANPANYYVNVHTQACPRGTIRGQLG